MHRRATSVIAISALVLGSLAISAGPALAACGSATSLENGGFETPGVATGDIRLFDASLVVPWLTTDGFGEIEIWGDGFGGVPAAEGGNFAELNANDAGTLYQDVVTTPGDAMTWTLQHRGRGGPDTMRVLIGDETTADVFSDSGWDLTSPDLTADAGLWVTHTGDYLVPDGQGCTRFAFRAVSTWSGSDSVGNFIDDISFAIPGPAAEPTAAPTAPPTDGVPVTGGRPDGVPAAILAIAGLLGVGLASRRMGRRDARSSDAGR